MSELQTAYRNGWYLRSAMMEDGHFTAWCKREMFTGSDVIDESGDVYFEFGSTRERAIDRLFTSLS